MNYHNITHDDLKNGEGIRTVLWVAGCSHECKGCQNPETWDPEGGIPFDEKAESELWDALDQDYCSGLTLSGGDPLYFSNRPKIATICDYFYVKYGHSKTIWLYTGYTLERLDKLKTTDPYLNRILKRVDVLVDGEFIEEQKNTKRYWVGSDNQRIWRRMTNGWIADAPQYEKSLNELNLDEQHHKKECGCE